MESKATVVLGASANPSRYSFLAVNRLLKHGHKVIPIGIREGNISGISILINTPDLKDIDTITLYLNPQRQKQYYDYILSLKPKRIIFNPGTENDELISLAESHGIKPIEGCTLVMLATGEF
ncbi:MAG: CoA-binding protein [Chitinophagales bacterium]|nr:CoA-binding protein [Chitinophagales bacterium]